MRKILLGFISCLLFCVWGHAFAAPHKKWTFLVYVNAKNSLDAFGVSNIIDMEKVGSNDEVNIVVEWGSLSTRKTVRLLVKKSTNPQTITSPVIEKLGEVDMGDYKTLQDFIDWGVRNYPANHYFIDVWDHGSGWRVKQAAANHHHQLSDISWDDTTGHKISTEELALVMQHAATTMGHKVDLYGSDACLMAMAEIADQMQSWVHYSVGSEEVEPGAGWPYATLLSRWETVPNATPAQVARILVKAYIDAYSGGRSDVTLSAFDLSKLPAFNQAMLDLGASLRRLNADEKNSVLEAARISQHFEDPEYIDFLDFLKKLTLLDIARLDPVILSNAKMRARQFIIANADTPWYANATGMSIWFPTEATGFNRYAERYKALQFQADTQWGDTLAALLGV